MDETTGRLGKAAVMLTCLLLAADSAAAQTATNPEDLTGQSTQGASLTGFGVVDASVDAKSGENRFTAGKLAVALFRELTDRTWIFGQLTASAASDPADGEAAGTDVEIDNLIFNASVPGSAVSLAFGKFDTPLGFERDDEPLNLQPTVSNTFRFARPAKAVGGIVRWSQSPAVDLSAWIANGWDGDLESNHGKTVGGRLGLRPAERTAAGLGFLYGPEGHQGQTQNRYLASVDYALQPRDEWIVAGEADYGGDRTSSDLPGTRWYGVTATVFRQFTPHVAGTVRAETFGDPDGARTGRRQRIESVSVAPLYFIGVGGEGIFATIEHTTLRIPRVQFRAELRWDDTHLETPSLGEPGEEGWRMTGIAQVVATF